MAAPAVKLSALDLNLLVTLVFAHKKDRKRKQ